MKVRQYLGRHKDVLLKEVSQDFIVNVLHTPHNSQQLGSHGSTIEPIRRAGSESTARLLFVAKVLGIFVLFVLHSRAGSLVC